MRCYFYTLDEGLNVLVCPTPKDGFERVIDGDCAILGLRRDYPIPPGVRICIPLGGFEVTEPMFLSGVKDTTNLPLGQWTQGFSENGFNTLPDDVNADANDYDSAAGFTVSQGDETRVSGLCYCRTGKYLTQRQLQLLAEILNYDRAVSERREESFAKRIVESELTKYEQIGFFASLCDKMVTSYLAQSAKYVEQYGSQEDKIYAKDLLSFLDVNTIAASSRIYVPKSVVDRIDAIFEDAGSLEDKYNQYLMKATVACLRPLSESVIKFSDYKKGCEPKRKQRHYE